MAITPADERGSDLELHKDNKNSSDNLSVLFHLLNERSILLQYNTIQETN